MRKIIFLLLVVYAGTLKGQELKFGVKAGLNLSSLRYDPEPPINFKLKPGFHIGGIFQYKLSEKFALESQLLYSQQGVKTQLENVMLYGSNPGDPFIGPPNGITVEATTMLNYINLPILAKYYFKEGLFVNLGPQLGYLINAKAEEKNVKFDMKEYYTDIDLGLNGGLGYEFPNGIIVNANYYLGLYDIYDVKSPFIEQEVKQNVIQFLFEKEKPDQ